MIWRLASPQQRKGLRVMGLHTLGVTTLRKLCPFFWHDMSVLPPSFVLMILMTMLSPSKMMRIQGQGPIPNVYMKPLQIANLRPFSTVLATRNASKL